MKKKWIFALFTTACAAACAVGLTACEKHTHSYTETITAPTCTEQGYTTHACSCGHNYVDTYVDALEHEFTDYVSDENATYTEDGTKTATCNRENCNETDTVTDAGSMLESKIEFATLLVAGTDVSGRVNNEIVEYDFNEEVAEIGLSSFVVSKDVYGSQTYLTKTVPLSAGENVYYVFEMQGGNIIKKYKVSIYRNPIIYTVQFENDYFSSQRIEEGGFVEEPTSEPIKLGYTFEWDYDFTQPVTENITIKGTWTVKEEMSNFEFTSTETTCEITGLIDKTVSTVVVPDYVTSIGERAFDGCSSLTSVVIPDSVTSIDSSTFYGCNSLAEITLPFVGATKNGTINTHFGYIFGASSGSDNNDKVPTSLKKVTVTGGAIDDCAFDGCSSLTNIVIPDSVTSIGTYAFLDCESLTSIVIPDSVTSIGSEAFGGCSSLTSVVIGDGVTSIGDIFRDCSSLTSITIPESVTSIGDSAFDGCARLMSVVIPESVTSIGKGAFMGCDKLTSIVIPKSVTSIGYRAFVFNDDLIPTGLRIYCEAENQPSGWDSEWNDVCPVYWYSESQPTTTGNYWHYDENGEIVVW